MIYCLYFMYTSMFRRDDARGLIVGLTGFNTKAHIVRAALEAAAFQVIMQDKVGWVKVKLGWREGLETVGIA